MRRIGRNPCRLTSVWYKFAATRLANGQKIRGVKEPVWTDRDPGSLDECLRHETLLNIAFSRRPAWSLLCPYNVDELGDIWAKSARLCHPWILSNGGGTQEESTVFRSPTEASPVSGDPFPAPRGQAEERVVKLQDLRVLRSWVSARALEAGLTSRREADFVLAVNEIAANSVKFGDAGGRIRLWLEPDSLICEISDSGFIANPMVARIRPE